MICLCMGTDRRRSFILGLVMGGGIFVQGVIERGGALGTVKGFVIDEGLAVH